MRGQLKQVLMACVAVIAVLALFDRWWGIVYVLLPTIPLLAALYPMNEWLHGAPQIWWYRFAVPWTIAAMAIVAVTPAAGKPVVSTLAVLVISIVTIALLTNKVLLRYYYIARSPTD